MERVFSAATNEKELNGSSSIKSPNKGSLGKQPSIRLDLKLFEPTKESFPEFNFSRLVNFEKKKQKKLSKLNNGKQLSDPFGEPNEDDEVARMAQNLEARYGQNSEYAKSNSAKVNKLDTMDRGAGYDENDSFIDNTEAYDELIPDEIETDRGGFYINSGALEFKKLSNYERPGDEIKMPKAKKRILSTSSEDSASEAEEEPKPLKETEHTKKTPELAKPKSRRNSHIEKKQKTGTSSSDEQAIKINKISIKEKEKEKQKEKEKEIDKVKELKFPKKIDKEDAGTASDSSKDNKKVIKTTTVKDMLRAQRDNLRKLELGKDAGGTTNSDSDSIAVNGDSSSSESEIEEDKPINGMNKEVPKEVPLPDQLPPNLLECINKLKEIALQNVTTLSQNNFFDARVKELLLKIDSGSRLCFANTRSQIFDHLENFLPCTKQTLNSRIRKLKQQGDDVKNKTELDQFKQMVNAMMPEMQERYDRELLSYNKAKMVQEIVGGSDTPHKDPKRKFLWNDSLRELLWELMGKRKLLFKELQFRKESEDDFLAKYIKETLIPIWPLGWMKKDLIVKEFERRKIERKDEKTKNNSVKSTPKPVLPEASKIVLDKTDKSDKVDKTQKSYSEILKSYIANSNCANSSNNSSNVKKNEGTVTSIHHKPSVTAVNLVNSNMSSNSGNASNSTVKHKQKPEKSEPKPAHLITSIMSSPTTQNSSNSKRASDHSISSIISSSPVPAEVNHSVTSNAKPTKNHSLDTEKPTNRGTIPSNEKNIPVKEVTKPKNSHSDTQTSTNSYKPVTDTNQEDSDSEVEFIAEFNQQETEQMVYSKPKYHPKDKEIMSVGKIEKDDVPIKKIKLGEESEEAEEAFDVNNVFRDLSFINMTEVKEDSKKSTNSEKSQFGNSPASSTFNSTSNSSKRVHSASNIGD